jgi:hypothetical protein
MRAERTRDDARDAAAEPAPLAAPAGLTASVLDDGEFALLEWPVARARSGR